MKNEKFDGGYSVAVPRYMLVWFVAVTLLLVTWRECNSLNRGSHWDGSSGQMRIGVIYNEDVAGVSFRVMQPDEIVISITNSTGASVFLQKQGERKKLFATSSSHFKDTFRLDPGIYVISLVGGGRSARMDVEIKGNVIRSE